VLLQLFAQLGFVEIMGEQIFDAAPPCGLGRRKAIDERQLCEQHRGLVDSAFARPEVALGSRFRET
jgi:hypothetical protein